MAGEHPAATWGAMTRALFPLTAAFALALALTGAGCSNSYEVQAYDLCNDSIDCTTAVDGCSFISTDFTTVGFCTNNCDDDLDCPTDIRGVRGACLSIDGSPPVCFERCLDDFDCPSPLFCTLTSGVSEAICFPE